MAIEGKIYGKVLSKNDNYLFLVVFGLLCCIFVSLINMMKEPEVDLAAYVYSYRLATNCDFLHYLLVGSHDTAGTYKDPLFYALVWIMNRLYMGDVSLFIFTLSMIEFLLMVFALIYLGKALKAKLFVVMFCIIILCFYPYIFTHTMNVVRQTIANSIVCFVAVRHFFYGRKDLLGILAMLLIHSTAFLFAPLLFFSSYKKPFAKAKIWYVGIIVGLFVIRLFAAYLFSAGDFEETSTIGYALTRAQEGSRGSFDQISLPSIVVAVVAFVYSFYLFTRKWSHELMGITGFSFIILFLSAFILINIDEHQISGRFHHYLGTMIPFLLLIFLKMTSFKDDLLLFAISIIIICSFTVYLHVGFWTYNVVAGGWLTPVYSYFF